MGLQALLVILVISYVSAQTCPTAPVPACPYSLTFVSAVVTSSSNVNAPGTLSSVQNSTMWNMQFTPTIPGKYTFNFAAVDLCKYTNQTQVVQARCPPAPTAVATPSNANPAQGQSITISVTGSAAAANFVATLDYTWSVVSSPVNSGVWAAGAALNAWKATGSDTLSISGSNLGVAGTYVVALAVSDGCSTSTTYACFSVICNCGPTASAGATPTVWSNVNTGSNRNNLFQSGAFTLKGGNSYDFDLLYNPTTERLTYSWDFVSWVPAAPLPFPNTIVSSPQIPSTKQPATWQAGDNQAATPNSVGYMVNYTPPTNGAGTIVKTWSFQQTPQLVVSSWSNTTTAGTQTTTSGSPSTTGYWVPAYDNPMGNSGFPGANSLPPSGTPPTGTPHPAQLRAEEWFQTEYLPAPPAGVPDQPTTTSIAAWVSVTTTVTTQTTPYTITNVQTTPTTGATITYCQIQITQAPGGGQSNAANYWEAQLAITGSFQWPIGTGSTNNFNYEQCRGLWTFSLTVQDGCGVNTQSIDQFKLTVRCNRPPVSVVACNDTVLWQSATSKFDQVTADGRSSEDMDNNQLTYYWQFVGTLPSVYTAACQHVPCVQTYCNDPTLYTGFTFPARPQTSPAPGTAGVSWGNGNNQGFTKGSQSGSCCAGTGTDMMCGPTVYPMFFRPSTPPPTGSTCRRWQTPPTAINPPSPSTQIDCNYPAIAPTGWHVGNSAYFTPNSPGTYRVQLTVYDGCSSVISQVSVVARCPQLSFSITLSQTTGTFNIVASSNPTVTITTTLNYPEGDYSKLTYSWTVANQAGGYSFSSPTALAPDFKPTSAPRTYTVQLTVADGCQSVSQQATYTLVCSQQSTQPTIEVFNGAAATGAPICQGTGANSVCSTTVNLESTGAQYPQVTLRANSTKQNGDPLTYTWTLDASTPYATSVTTSPSNQQTLTFRPSFSSAVNSAGFNVKYSVVAFDGCSNSVSSQIQINFGCTGTLAAAAVGSVVNVQYGFSGSSGSFPAVVFSGLTSTTPYPANTAWTWSITYTSGAGNIGVSTGIAGAAGGSATPIGNITFTASIVTRYTISLTLTDACKSVTSTASLTTSCPGNPTAIITTPAVTAEWDSFKTTYLGGFPLVTLKSNSTGVVVSAPATNNMPVIPFWSPSTAANNLATGSTLSNSGDVNPTFTPGAPGSYLFTLSVTNGPCSSATPATATVTATCLTITATIAPAATTIAWDGVRFPTVELDGTSSTYTRSTGGATNYYALNYEWLFTDSPSNSIFEKSRTVTTPGTPTQNPANPALTSVTSTNAQGHSVLNMTGSYTVVTTTTQIVYKTTLFNHHYNKPMTCFKPDVVGTYTVQLTINDGCVSGAGRITSRTVTVRCNNPVTPAVTAAASVTLNGTAYQRVTLDGSATAPANAADTLTYEWTLTSRPTTITTATPKVTSLSAGTASIMNSNGNIASFVPDVAGTFVVTLTVFDGCNVAQTKTTTITVLCNSRIVVATPSVLIGTTLSTATVPSIDFISTANRFNGQTFTIQGMATTNCEVFARSWTLTNRQCADTYQPAASTTPPPTPSPLTSCAANNRVCVWTVATWPCTAADAVTANTWVRPVECSGTGLATCTLTNTNANDCSAVFTPRFPGQYVLKLTVSDNCSSATANTTVTARCEKKAVAQGGPDQVSLYTCTGSSYAYQTVTLNGNSSSLDNTPSDPTSCPAVVATTPAPAAPAATGQCCPAPAPCAQCAQCPNCQVCSSTTSTAGATRAHYADAAHRSFAAEEETVEADSNLLLGVIVPISVVTVVSVLANVVMLAKVQARRRSSKLQSYV